MKGPRGPKKRPQKCLSLSLLEMWLCLPRTGLLWGTMILFKMTYIAWLLCYQWHPHTVFTQPLIFRYSVNIPYRTHVPPKTLPTSSFFLPIQCNIAPKINPKRYFKLLFVLQSGLNFFCRSLLSTLSCLFCNALSSAKSELTIKWQWIGLPTNF